MVIVLYRKYEKTLNLIRVGRSTSVINPIGLNFQRLKNVFIRRSLVYHISPISFFVTYQGTAIIDMKC